MLARLFRDGSSGPVSAPSSQHEDTGDFATLEEHIGASLEMLSEATGLLAILWLTAPCRSVSQRGLARLLAQPEFHDAQALVPLMDLIERASALGFFLENALMKVRFRVVVGIGEPEGGLAPFSLVAGRLSSENPAGVLAVFGPNRMDYRTVIPTVSLATRVIGDSRARS
jgi:transcriptional regulator of heat shock response